MFKHLTKDGIAQYDDILSAEECRELMSLQNKTGHQYNNYDNTREYDVDVPQHYTDRFTGIFREYLKHYNILDIYQYTGSKMQYTNGNIHVHCDLEQYHDQPLLRHFSVLIYLNGDDIDGGELILPRQKVVIKPKTGQFVIFPIGVFYPHLVNICYTDVKRWALRPFWLLDPYSPLYLDAHYRSFVEDDK